MTAREPSAVEVIAAHQFMLSTAIKGDAFCTCFEAIDVSGRGVDYDLAEHQIAALKAAGFVVATRDEIRAMTPEQQAELIGGEVQPCSVNPECGHHVRIVREVRP